jgi:hypothetical protein
MSNGKPLKAINNANDALEIPEGDVASRKPPRSASSGDIAMSARQPVIQYANEKARIAWELGQEIAALSKDIPAEEPTLDAKTITFAPENRTRGTYAIFLAGTVIGTNESGVFVVPQRSLQILERLHIHYRVV